MTPHELRNVVDASVDALTTAESGDWSKPAGSLEWTCRDTADHLVDCVFSYAFQLAARAQSGFLPFGELHALPGAEPRDLVKAIAAVGSMLAAVALETAEGVTASDGVMALDAADWCARGAYEIALHSYDVLAGQCTPFELDASLSRAITASPALWMFDRSMAAGAADPWSALLRGSGRRHAP